MKVYSHSSQGKRKTQEDEHYYLLNIDHKNENYYPINLFCVFDGHGGGVVSKYLKNNLPEFFIKINKNIYKNNKSTSKYIEDVYNRLQDNLKITHLRAVEYSGSTACVCINYLYKNNNYLWLINVGDSRAIMCNGRGEAVQLTIDHKPNHPDEKERIEKLGGKISFDGVEWRIKSLSLSRAFGDLDCSPYVTHLPSIYKYKIKKDDKFLILACDGLYDSLTNDEIVKFIGGLQFKNFNGNYAKELANYAIDKGSQDNVSVIIYFFN